MDLTLLAGDTTLNIRVAVLVRTKRGIIVENHASGYSFLLGGRVQVNETSEDAARREVFEEIGVEVKNLRMKAVVENFFKQGSRHIHEICLVYSADEIPEVALGEKFAELNPIEVEQSDLKPKIMKRIVEHGEGGILHAVQKDAAIGTMV